MTNIKPKEIIVLTVEADYYSEHIDIFSSNEVKIKSVYVEGEDHEEDIIHKQLMKAYMKAKKDLRDYEFDKRHKIR
jgi:hypothetical protein